MKNSIKFVFIFVIFLMIFAVNASQAGVYFGLQAGYSAQKPSLKDVEFDTNTAFLFGARAGVKFLMFGIEANYFQAAHNMELKDFVTLSWGGRQVDYHFVGLNFKYFFPILIVHPYLSAGYGYYTADVREIDEDTKTGYNIGLGVELQIAQKIGLLAEGRYHLVNLDIDQQKLKLGNFTVSGGLNIYF